MIKYNILIGLSVLIVSSCSKSASLDFALQLISEQFEWERSTPWLIKINDWWKPVDKRASVEAGFGDDEG